MKVVRASVVMVVVALLAVGSALGQDNTVTVTGKAEVKQEPDVVYVLVYVTAGGGLMTDAAKEADRKVEQIKKAVQERFKEVQSFVVSDVAVGESLRQEWGPMAPGGAEDAPQPEITRRIRIAADPDSVQVYEIVDCAVGAGASMRISRGAPFLDIGGRVVVYGLIESAELEARARQRAMADARRRAENLAALAGKKVGDVVKIVSLESSAQGEWMMGPAGVPLDLPTKYLSMNPDEVAIAESVSVTFELKNE